MSVPAALVGSWKLVSITIQLTDTDEAIDLYGPKPKGGPSSPRMAASYFF